MTYYLYHIPGKKIGVTRDLKERVEHQQGYEPGEYGVLTQTDDIDLISNSFCFQFFYFAHQSISFGFMFYVLLISWLVSVFCFRT